MLSQRRRNGHECGLVPWLSDAAATEESFKVFYVDSKKCRSDAQRLECPVGYPTLNGALVHLKVIGDLLNCYVTRGHFALHS